MADLRGRKKKGRKKGGKTLLVCKPAWRFGLLICFSAVTHSILLLHVWVLMSESVQLSPSSGVFGWWEESGMFGTWVTFQHIHFLALSLSLSLFLPPPPSPWQKRKKKKQRHAWPAGGWTDSKGCSQTPISLVSTHRGTVRIQNTHPRPKPRNAPLSAPCQLPVCYVKVPLAVNHAAGFRGS